MPIEFSCTSCNKLLRVPDGTEGKTCQCPACDNVGVIPDLRPAREVTASANSSNPVDDLPDGLVRVTCPKCQYPLRCKSELLGTKGQCKQCKHIFTIGDNKIVAEDVTAMIFSCPKCDQLFDGKPEMEGRKGKCHACGEVFHIKLRAANANTTKSDKSATEPMPTSKAQAAPQTTSRASTPSRQGTSSTSNSAQAGKNTAQPKKPVEAAPTKLQVICGSCQGMMQVPTSSAGKKVTCPHCSQLLQVPGGDSKQSGGSIFDQNEDEVFGVLDNSSSGSSSPFSFGSNSPSPNYNTPTYPASSGSGNYGYTPPMPYVPVPNYPPAPTPYAGPTTYSAPDPYAPTTSAYQYLSSAESELRQEKSLSRNNASHNLLAARVILFCLAAVHFMIVMVAVLIVNAGINRYLRQNADVNREELVVGTVIVIGAYGFVTLSLLVCGFLIRTLPLLSSIIPLVLYVPLAILLNIGDLNVVRLTIDLASVCAMLKVLFDGINYRH